MMFTILTTLEVASLVVLAVSLHGSARAVCSDSRRKKMSPLELLSRYPRMYRRVAAVWGRYAVGTFIVSCAWWGAFALMGGNNAEPSLWVTSYMVALIVFRVLSGLMAVVALYYYMRSRKCGDYGDESPSLWTEREESEISEVRQISAESVNEKASKLGGAWERELAGALNRQAGRRTH